MVPILLFNQIFVNNFKLYLLFGYYFKAITKPVIQSQKYRHLCGVYSRYIF